MKAWSGSKAEYESEVSELCRIVEDGWAWQWPGWEWVAKTMNNRFGTNRTAESCRKKHARIYATKKEAAK